jgi:aspartate aminotransferase
MFAERMSFIKPSGTLKLSSMAAELRAKGKDVISFGLGEMDYPTPEVAVDAAKEALDQGLTKYGPSTGLPELREEIATYSRDKCGIPCGPENVIVTPAKFAIYMSCVALVDRGEEVLIPDPGWVSYKDMVRAVDAKPKYYKLKKGYFLPDEEDLKELITEKTKLIMLNTPSNPAGSVFPRETLEMIGDLAKDNDIYVVSDEIYEKQVFEGEHHSLASMDGMADRTITVNGFSKTYSMTGWRIGWLTASDDLVAALGRLQGHTITCLPTFVQKGGLAAMKGSQAFVDETTEELRRKRDLVYDKLSSMDGLDCHKPEGTFYIFPRYDFDMPSSELAERILNESSLLVIPGSAFGPAGENYFRIAFAKEDEVLEQGLRRLELALGKIKR